MSKKLLFLISFVLVLVLAGNVLAYNILIWDNDKTTGDRLWQTATNWDLSNTGKPSDYKVPEAGEWAVIEKYADPCNNPIINADTNAICEWMDLGAFQPVVGECILTMTGGTLRATTWLDMGGYYPGTYRWDISGGDIYTQDVYVGYVTDSYSTLNVSDGNITNTGSFMIGSEDATQADFNMTGGDVNCGDWFQLGSSWGGYPGNGNLDLKGGTIRTGLLSMGGGGVGTMDLAGGTLIIDGDYRVPNDWLFDPCSDTVVDWDPTPDALNPPPAYKGTIAILAKSGVITAYGARVGDIITGGSLDGLRAVVNLDYGVANPGKTTLTGGAVDPDLAWDPDPLFGSGGLSKMDVNLLSWVAGDNAASHDVYFGTSWDDVNDGTGGTSKGNQPLADVNYPVSVTWDTTYYWRVDEVNGPTLKGTVWNFVTKKAWATNPSPFWGATGVDALSPVISWDPGPEANDVSGHYVYLSTDFNDVNDRDPCVMTVRDPNNYAPLGGLELNTKYYWAVDEVNLSEDPNTWPSRVWDFNTAAYLNVDNLNPYADNDAIRAVWRKETDAQADAVIEVATDPRRGGGKSMMYAYRNALTSGAEANAVTTDLFAGTDWTAKGVKALMLYFYGDAGNGQEMHANPQTADYTVDNDQMYVALEDGSANVGIVKYYDKVEGYDMNNIQEEFWHQWNIDLADPCLSAVDMNNVVKVYIGFGGAKTGQTVNGVGWKSGHYDTVWFDDIRLWPPRCISVKVKHDLAGGDCKTDFNDIDIMGRDWLMYDYNVAAVAISGDPCGWWTFDSGHPSKTAYDSAGDNDGTITDASWSDGYPNDPNDSGLHFDADGIATYDHVLVAERAGAGGSYPAELMPATFTVACWVKIDSFEYYDTFVTNGVDQGTMGIFSSGFTLYANNPESGLDDRIPADIGYFGMGIRTTDDIYYVATPNIYKTDTWYHLAGTYNDANKASVYVDGKLAEGPTDVGGPIRWTEPEPNDYPNTFVIGALPDRISMLYWFYAKANIDDVRVYGYALPPGEIVTLAEQGPTVYHDLISPANLYDLEAKLSKIVNFRDYRMLADHWLDDPILWP